MWHLLVLPFILVGFLVSGAMAAAGVALFVAFLVPLMLLGLLFRIGFFFLKAGLIVALLAVLLIAFI